MLNVLHPRALRRHFRRPFSGFQAYSALESGIWVIVLPIVFFSYGHVDAAPTLIFIIAFAMVYPFLTGSLSYYPRGLSQRCRYIFALSIVVGFGVASAPIVGYKASAFLPFAAALISQSLSLIYALTSILALGITLVGISQVFGYLDGTDTSTSVGFSLMSLCWSVFICLIIQIGKASEEASKLNQEIELSHQRESIARDVHDVLGHSLTLISLKAEVARRLIHSDSAAAEDELRAITTLARTSLAEVRSTVTRMRHPDLAGELAAASRAFETANIQASLPDDVSNVVNNAKLFSWVIREATTNIIRHSQARNVRIEISPSSVRIIDDGVGFDAEEINTRIAQLYTQKTAVPPNSQQSQETDFALASVEDTRSHSGLDGLAQRVHAAGGLLIIDSSPQSGTTIAVTMTKQMP